MRNIRTPAAGEKPSPNNLSKYRWHDLPPLTPELERELLARAKAELARAVLTRKQAGDTSAADELIAHLHRHVRSFCAKWQYISPDLFNDAMGAGLNGLAEAIDRFDLSRPERLKTYATPWIKKYIREEVKRICRPGGGETRCDRWVAAHPDATIDEICAAGFERHDAEQAFWRRHHCHFQELQEQDGVGPSKSEKWVSADVQVNRRFSADHLAVLQVVGEICLNNAWKCALTPVQLGTRAGGVKPESVRAALRRAVKCGLIVIRNKVIFLADTVRHVLERPDEVELPAKATELRGNADQQADGMRPSGYANADKQANAMSLSGKGPKLKGELMKVETGLSSGEAVKVMTSVIPVDNEFSQKPADKDEPAEQVTRRRKNGKVVIILSEKSRSRSKDEDAPVMGAQWAEPAVYMNADAKQSARDQANALVASFVATGGTITKCVYGAKSTKIAKRSRCARPVTSIVEFKPRSRKAGPVSIEQRLNLAA
jgi:hypothetical protein